MRSKGHSEESAIGLSSVLSVHLSVVSKKLACIDLKDNTQVKEALYDPIYRKHPEQINPSRRNTDWWLPGVGARREGGQTAEEEFLLWSDGNIFKLDRGGGCTTRECP